MPKKAFVFNLKELAEALQEKYNLPSGPANIAITGHQDSFKLTVTYE